ncbi:N-acetyltransferase [Sandarakinorhabdus sp.]|uniref:GNAT family N-acetyltransferase n=1 Tax=Sandarakinorhabdus sp. TaxID=1916663 RepID=UPI00286DAB98|nr:N-acetyltransferase [Sandarakinorhabdus sp.]
MPEFAIQFASLLPADVLDIDMLLDARFGPARRGRTAYRLRDGMAAIPGLSFVARNGAALVGSLQSWPLQLRAGNAVHPLILLGPVAVAADRQGEGIASALMSRALTAADAAGAPPIVLIGDAPFYGRFGFAADATRHWVLPGPVDRARLLLRGGAALPVHGALEPGVSRRAAA